jgi:antibiotic biosynthesis monooxygenase (ABM) superfamily enzyme
MNPRVPAKVILAGFAYFLICFAVVFTLNRLGEWESQRSLTTLPHPDPVWFNPLIRFLELSIIFLQPVLLLFPVRGGRAVDAIAMITGLLWCFLMGYLLLSFASYLSRLKSQA